MTMIERVARAMAAGDSGPEGSYLFEIHWEEFGEGYCNSARDAIEAMREPTVGMMSIVASTHDFRDASIYRPFIDAALNEKGS